MNIRDIKPGTKLLGLSDYAGGCIVAGESYVARKYPHGFWVELWRFITRSNVCRQPGEIYITCSHNHAHELQGTAMANGDIPELTLLK